MPRVQHHLCSSAHLPKDPTASALLHLSHQTHTTKQVLSRRHLRFMVSHWSLVMATFDIPKTVACFPEGESSLGLYNLCLSHSPWSFSVLHVAVFCDLICFSVLIPQKVLGKTIPAVKPATSWVLGVLEPTSPASAILLMASINPLPGFILQAPQNKLR